MPSLTAQERDALWWTCVLERDMDSLYGAFVPRGEPIYDWNDDGEWDAELDAPSTAIILCPDYGYLATRMRGAHRNADAQWHEDRYRAIHEYLSAARILPTPLHNDPAPEFTSTLVQALNNVIPPDVGRLRLDVTLNNSNIEKGLSRFAGGQKQ